MQGLEIYPQATRNRERLYASVPLDHAKKQFRLLKLYKDPDGIRLRGRLIVQSLDSQKPFDGLSYTWDASWGLNHMELNQLPVWIPNTLYLALESLRYQFRTQSTNSRFTSVLWVDSICVNQDDPAERTAQLAILPDIHSRSSNVLVSLGLLNTVEVLPVKAIWGHAGAACPLDLEDIQPSVKEQSTVIEDFIWKNAPAFRGPWIIQQVALSRNVPLVFYRRVKPEPFTLCWDCFCHGFRRLRRALWKRSSPHLTLERKTIRIRRVADRRLMMHLDYIDCIRRFIRGARPGTLTLFEEALRMAATVVQATDPRNKVYSLLRMFPQSAGNNMVFNYNRSAATVLGDAVEYAINNTGCLGILSVAGLENAHHDPSLSGCPSWVPRFTAQPIQGVPTWKLPHPRLHRGTAYRSSRDLRVPEHVEVLQGSRLVLYGIPIDAVTLVGPLPDPVDQLKRRSAIAPAKVFLSAAKTCGRCSLCPEGVIEARPAPGWWGSGSEAVPTVVFASCFNPVYSPNMAPVPPKQAKCLPGDFVYLYRHHVTSTTSSWTTTSIQPCNTSGSDVHPQSAVPWHYSVNKPFEEAFWRAFVADFLLWKNNQKLFPFQAPPPEDARDWILHALHKNTPGQLVGNIHNVLWGGPGGHVDRLTPDGWSLVYHSMDSVVAGCPFVTAGGWLGFGPSCMKTGDVVVVLAGADVPLVIRRKDESGDFLLVGEAYVDGLMFGELFEHCPAFEDNDEEYGIRMQRFCFC
ncbi:uncharacterized protein B0H64DRAFT_434252 [Chaetomium fimeti]|uniref:Heterokaryon incompatibility domain-containing protein n=1 Tax=Chaetomium fimeti TaxID=1854472 RepID=A0AAE0HAP7_9PEZI|nr:hypothetical protein B0H64DRAFT_434252 [Chaetomium fimeti]